MEYGDYECPHCGAAHPIVKRVQASLGDNLCFVYRHFLLTEIHPHAMHAAQAAEAAGMQGQFREMHDLIFANQQTLTDQALKGFAAMLGLDLQKWLRDFFSEGVEAKIAQDFGGGIRSGVNGTPTFFINGVRHDAPYDFPILLAALQRHLPDQAGIRQKARPQ